MSVLNKGRRLIIHFIEQGPALSTAALPHSSVLITDKKIVIYIIIVISLQVGLAVVNGQLYAVGGFDGTAYLKTIEVYDTEQNQWRLCGAMNYRRLGGGVGVMRAPQTENRIW